MDPGRQKLGLLRGLLLDWRFRWLRGRFLESRRALTFTVWAWPTVPLTRWQCKVGPCPRNSSVGQVLPSGRWLFRLSASRTRPICTSTTGPSRSLSRRRSGKAVLKDLTDAAFVEIFLLLVEVTIWTRSIRGVRELREPRFRPWRFSASENRLVRPFLEESRFLGGASASSDWRFRAPMSTRIRSSRRSACSTTTFSTSR